MTGPRELTVLQAFRDLAAASENERITFAVQSIAVSVAALADLYELELACYGDEDDADEREDASEAHPS